MQREELFRRDIESSERDALKINVSYIKLKDATKGKPEIGVIFALLNIPSYYLYRREGKQALDRLLVLLKEHSGFSFGGGSSSNHIHSKSFAIESTYTIVNKLDNRERIWTGSFNHK